MALKEVSTVITEKLTWNSLSLDHTLSHDFRKEIKCKKAF